MDAVSIFRWRWKIIIENPCPSLWYRTHLEISTRPIKYTSSISVSKTLSPGNILLLAVECVHMHYKGWPTSKLAGVCGFGKGLFPGIENLPKKKQNNMEKPSWLRPEQEQKPIWFGYKTRGRKRWMNRSGETYTHRSRCLLAKNKTLRPFPAAPACSN